MTDLQRIVKYCAIALAFTIIIGIATTIISGVSFLFNAYDDTDQNLIDAKEIEIVENVTKLKIDLKATNLRVESADQFSIQTNNGKIKYSTNGNTLTITERGTNIFKNKTTKDLVIYVPSNTLLDELSLEAGAGRVKIDNLTVKELELDLGAGTVDLNNIKTKRKTSIDGGAGELIITNSILNNLELDMGVGSLDLTAELIGENEISCGVGEVDIILVGSDYTIQVDKGLGETIIAGKTMRDNEVYGTGRNELEIDGGVGSINIDFQIPEDASTKF